MDRRTSSPSLIYPKLKCCCVWRTIFDVERGRTQPGIATYKDGSGTTTLHFEYIFGFDDTTLDLECNDNHSLHLGFDSVNPGCIKQASANPTIAANLELPFPGTTGSLGSNSYIKIGSRQPFVTLESTRRVTISSPRLNFQGLCLSMDHHLCF